MPAEQVDAPPAGHDEAIPEHDGISSRWTTIPTKGGFEVSEAAKRVYLAKQDVLERRRRRSGSVRGRCGFRRQVLELEEFEYVFFRDYEISGSTWRSLSAAQQDP